MREIPSGWKEIKFPDAYWFQEGPGVRRWQFKDSGIKLLNVANITTDEVLDLSKTDRHLDPEEVKQKYQHFLVDAGDLVMASSGISFDADGFLRTRSAFVGDEHLPLCMNTSTIRFKSKDGVSDLRFLKYWLQSFEFRAQVSRFVTGSAQLNFGPSHLKKMSIALPPLEEQQRIAAILDKADALRAQRRAALAKLDTLLRAAFLDMFGDPVTNPMGWEVVKLGSLTNHVGSGATPRGGSSVYSDQGFLFIRSQNVLMFEFDFSDVAYIDREIHDDMQRSKVKNQDVLLNITGASIGRVNYFVGDDDSANVNQHVCIIRPSTQVILPEYLTYHLGMPSYLAKILGQNAGATRQAFNFKQIKGFQIILPPVNRQREFTAAVCRVKELRGRYVTAASTLDDLFHSLQQRAFKGEL